MYSGILKSQQTKKDTTNNKKRTTLANPQQPVPPTTEKLFPVVASASVPTVAASQGQMAPPEKIPRS